MPDFLVSLIALTFVLLFWFLLYFLCLIDQKRRFYFVCLLYSEYRLDIFTDKYRSFHSFFLGRLTAITTFCDLVNYDFEAHEWQYFKTRLEYLLSYHRLFHVSDRALRKFLIKYFGGTLS